MARPDVDPRPEDCLEGGGEMGALMRSIDWSRTPLGPVASWPQSLRTTVSTCLGSRFPILVWWGRDLVKLYNDAYREILGAKHPAAMGRPGREVWPEIWDVIGPMLESVLTTGRATWSEDLMLPLVRHGFAEECYFTFSYSPIRDESGGVGGVFCAVTETTTHVIGNRRLATLRELAARALDAKSADEACANVLDVLARNPADVPFAAIYLLDADGDAATLAGACTLDAAAPLPARIDDAAAITGLRSDAVVLPLRRAGQDRRYGYLVAGVSPRRPLDDAYRGFLDLVASQVGSAIATATSHAEERRRAEALAELDRAKTAFFSNVSHEFRTPLTLLLGPIEDALAERAALPEDTVERLEIVHRNALRLSKLVNTMLDFSRIEAGRIRGAFEPTDLAEVTRDVASHFQSLFDRAGLALRIDAPPLPAPVHVDRDLWEKIVLNLVSNAFKFTWEGEVGVRLAWCGDHVELVVRDTGIGIAPEELPRVFERFHRNPSVRARTHEGTGIGLAFVDELARLHGGGVTVTSELGRGSTFTVSIPTGSAHLPADQVGGESPAAATTLRGAHFVEEAARWTSEHARTHAHAGDGRARILVADDNADMRAYVTRTLASRYDVEAVADGAAALEAIRTDPPDLVITDIMMPVMDGVELLRTIRADPALHALPTILLSARAGEEASAEGLEAGASDYLIKPFATRELLARVETQLTVTRLRALAEHERQKLERVFMGAPFAAIVFEGPEFEVVFQNSRCREILGGRDLVGRPAFDVVPELRGQPIEQHARRVLETGAPYVMSEVAIELPGDGPGGPRYFDVAFQPTVDLDGCVTGVIAAGYEVTEAVRSRAALIDANRAKDEFLAMLGHELRNPLAPIVTALELLKLRGDERGAKERRVIERQVRHLNRLVDDLLDVARITRGKIDLRHERLAMRDVITKAVEMVSPLFEERRHELTVDAPDGLHVRGDEGRLIQVVGNLLGNAAKYTLPGGRVAIRASLEGDRVVVRVRDTGVGIAPDLLPRIFDLFVQGRRASDRADGGLGLGLALVHSLVHLHGGTVEAASDGPGRGSELTVRLPALDAAQAADVARRDVATGVTPPTARRRILVVDDNEDAAATLAELLRGRGHEVVVAHDGPQALAKASAFRPTVAILDIGLPVMDGYELAERLRPQGLWMVAVSGYGQERDRARSREAGFALHLVKPVDTQELIAAIEEAELSRSDRREPVG